MDLSPGPASPGAERLGVGEVGAGRQGYEARVQVLPADASRKEAASLRRIEMEADGGSDRPRDVAR